MAMNPVHLAAFRAVATAGGFVKAAGVLHLSQPAVSSHVAALEEDLGVRLLDRLPTGAVPTAEGRLLLGYAERLAGLEAAARSELEALAGLHAGRLAVGASSTIGVYLLPGLLGRFREQAPGVQLEAVIGNSAAVRARLLDGTLDLGLTEGEPPSDPGLRVESFREDHLVVIAPAGHPLAGKKRPRAKDLHGVPMVRREPGSGTRAVADAALAAAGVEPGEALVLAHTEAIKRAVAAGLGLAIVSELAVADEQAPRGGPLAVLRPVGLRLTRPLFVLTPAERTPSPAAAAFATLLSA